jgi:hypothetical protein
MAHVMCFIFLLFNWFYLHIIYCPMNSDRHTQMITFIGEISTWFSNIWIMIWRKYCTIVSHPKSRYSKVLTEKIRLAFLRMTRLSLQFFLSLDLYEATAKRIALLSYQQCTSSWYQRSILTLSGLNFNLFLFVHHLYSYLMIPYCITIYRV